MTTTVLPIKYPLASTTWDDAEHQAMQSVITSGNFTMGTQVSTFERAFAEFVGSRYALMVNSGSSANLLMVAALFYTQTNPLKPGDGVIVPAVSWPTTYYPLAQYGLKLHFVDVDPDTLNYHLPSLQKALVDNPEVRLVMAVNLLGNPNDFGQIEGWLNELNQQGRDIRLIEDNCESLGATLGGKQAGTFGVMGSYSSFFSHHISTMEGGLVVTDDEELYHILLCLRSHGWTRHLPTENRITGTKSPNSFEEAFKFVLPGYNVRPGELNGALGQQQLKKLPALIAERRANALRFVELFANHPLFSLQQEVGASSWFGFSLILKPHALAEYPQLNRQKVIEALELAKIDCRPIVAGNFAKNPVMNWFNYAIEGDLAHADWLDAHGFFVGNHHYSLEKELAYLAKTLAPQALLKE